MTKDELIYRCHASKAAIGLLYRAIGVADLDSETRCLIKDAVYKAELISKRLDAERLAAK